MGRGATRPHAGNQADVRTTQEPLGRGDHSWHAPRFGITILLVAVITCVRDVVGGAGGVDVVYPEENRALYENIKESGVVLSEMPPGTEPQARHFPRRNRIISGLSLGVLVVEAAPRSGSLITARLGLEQNREVFAVPGSPLDPRARGCNHLIRQGATLVENAQDVLEVLESMIKTPLEEPKSTEFEPGTPLLPPEFELEAGRKSVLELLGPSPVMVDEVIRQCQLSPAVVNLVLLELELAGRLERHPGNRVALIAEGTGEAT